MPEEIRELTTGIAQIKTHLTTMSERMAEDRLAGIESRKKIDRIDTNTQVLTTRLDTHISEDDKKFGFIWKVFWGISALGGGSVGIFKFLT